MDSPANYRPEIDGMRAVAVIAVIIFHAFPHLVPGGFVGVDVFFVISGYLITGIIQRQIASGNFSVKQFYLRRIKRIMPAYFVVSIFTIAAGTLLLTPNDYVYLTTSLAASWAFASNIFFSLLNGGYFAQRMETFPLLHTWSLAVEEQFYFLFPAILICVNKIARKHFVEVVALMLIFFSVISEFGTSTSSGFFLLQYRAHELLTGSLALFLSLKHPPKSSKFCASLGGIGLILIIASIALFNGKTTFPGYNSLLPCVGAALILYSSGTGGLANKILSTRALVFLGMISYSLYLWHWPIFAYIRVYEIEFTAAIGCLAVAATTVAAYLSWRFVETPVRRMTLSFNKTFLYWYLAPALVFGLVGLISYKTNGIPNRFPPDIRALMETYGAEIDLQRSCSIKTDGEANISMKSIIASCSFGDLNQAQPAILLIGDSHANHFKPFLNELALGANMRAVYHVQGNCIPIDFQSPEDLPASNTSCRKRNAALFAIAGKFKYVVLAGNWPYGGDIPLIKNQLTRAISEIIQSGSTPVIFKDNPNTNIDRSRCVLNVKLGRGPKDVNCNIPLKEILAAQGTMNSIIDEVAQAHKDLLVINPQKVMCNQFECSTFHGNMAFYRDANHLNEAASAFLGKEYVKSYGNPFLDGQLHE